MLDALRVTQRGSSTGLDIFNVILLAGGGYADTSHNNTGTYCSSLSITYMDSMRAWTLGINDSVTTIETGARYIGRSIRSIR